MSYTNKFSALFNDDSDSEDEIVYEPTTKITNKKKSWVEMLEEEEEEIVLNSQINKPIYSGDEIIVLEPQKKRQKNTKYNS